MKKKNKDKVIVLLSGGIDSSACINFYLNLKCDVKAIFIKYGQESEKKEEVAARNICKYFKIRLTVITVIGFKKKFKDNILGRNAFLLLTALMNTENERIIIALGIHDGTQFEDCTSNFVKRMQALFDIYTHGVIQIGTPFLKMYKDEIIAYSITNNLPLEMTYSCELGKKQPCNKCLSCRDLKKYLCSK